MIKDDTFSNGNKPFLFHSYTAARYQVVCGPVVGVVWLDLVVFLMRSSELVHIHHSMLNSKAVQSVK